LLYCALQILESGVICSRCCKQLTLRVPATGTAAGTCSKIKQGTSEEDLVGRCHSKRIWKDFVLV